MKDGTKAEIVAYTIIGILFVLIIWGMFFWIISDNENLDICAKEYGYERIGKLEGRTSTLDYKFQPLNSTHIVCCKKINYLMNGEIRNLNCTGMFAK